MYIDSQVLKQQAEQNNTMTIISDFVLLLYSKNSKQSTIAINFFTEAGPR